MKRTLLLLFLTVCLLTTSLLSMYGLSTKYVMSPYVYFERITTVFDNMPLAKDIEVNFNVFDSEEYIELGLQLPVWEKVEVDSITDVVPAIKSYVNYSMTYTAEVVKQTFKMIPNLFYNFAVLVKNAAGLVPKVIVYVGKTIVNVFRMKGFVVTAVMSLVPLDWEQMQEDDVDIKLFFFGRLRNIPFSKYYGIVTEDDIDPPTTDTDTDTDTGTGGYNDGFIMPDTGGSGGAIDMPTIKPVDPSYGNGSAVPV